MAGPGQTPVIDRRTGALPDVVAPGPVAGVQPVVAAAVAPGEIAGGVAPQATSGGGADGGNAAPEGPRPGGHVALVAPRAEQQRQEQK